MQDAKSLRLRKDTWDSYIVKSVVLHNEYSLPDSLKGATVVDIGAHIGSFVFACQIRNAKEVFAFEPDKENFELLAYNAEAAETDTEVMLFPYAVRGKHKDAVYIRRLTDHDQGVGRNTGHVDTFGEEGEGQKAEALGINEILSEAGKVDILKMDCEGAEWEIFEEGDFSNVGVLMAELHKVNHPDFEGKTLVELGSRAQKLLRKQGFEVSVSYQGDELGKIFAANPNFRRDVVPSGLPVEVKERRRRVLWWGDALANTGYSRVTENVTKGLHLKGWDVSILGIGYNGDPHNLEAGIDVYPACGMRDTDPFGRDRSKHVIELTKPDVLLLQNDSWIVSGWLAYLGMVNQWTPAVGYVAVDSENVRGDVATQLNNLKHLVAHTEFGVEQLRKSGYAGTASFAPHGVDTSIYRPHNKEEARRFIDLDESIDISNAFFWGYINANQPRKRTDLVLAYFAAWWEKAGKPDNAYLYVHTNMDGSCDITQLADYLGIRGRVLSTAAGQNLKESYLAALYSACDCLLSASEGESFGLTSLEGMACGVPGIAVKCAGLESWAGDAIEWVEAQQYAFTMNRTNSMRRVVGESEFVAAMDRIYRDAQRREELSSLGIELAKSLTWGALTEHIDGRLNDVLQRRAAAATANPLDDF